MDQPSLFGHCPDCDFDLDGGGNEDCPTCAAEPPLIDITDMDNGLTVVATAREVDAADFYAWIQYHWPDRSIIPTLEGLAIATGHMTQVAILDIGVGQP